MRPVILDASALLALIFEEKGSAIVGKYLQGASMSTVNMTEVATYIGERCTPTNKAETLLRDLAITIIPYDEEQAFLAAALYRKTKVKGLSLGDRACLALAIIQHLPVLTADKAWSEIDVGVKVKLIR
jgi:PIN domain nuclease of toxin-antitoxin system